MIETTAEHFLAVLKAGTVSTNVYLRRIHNYAVNMHWLPWPVLPKPNWPAVKHGDKRAITFEEHQKIINRELNPATRAYYEILWHFGGAQTGVATLTAEDINCGSGVFLVGAFRRLIHHWRSKNHWQPPDVQTLKAMLKQSIFGVELQEEAVHLTAFSLALAVCDALQPNVIWGELRFDKMAGSNLLTGDLFDHGDKITCLAGDDGFAAIIGNPPFLSKLTDAAKKALAKSNVPDAAVPDNQMAYFIAHQAMPLLKSRGRMPTVAKINLFLAIRPYSLRLEPD